MYTVKTWLGGLFKDEKYIFVSRTFDHVEVTRTITLFGKWVVHDTSREVYLPDMDKHNTEDFNILWEVYTDIYSLVKEIRHDRI